MPPLFPDASSRRSGCRNREATGQVARKLGLLLDRCNSYKGATRETFCHFRKPPASSLRMTNLILIPARMASTRLPGKPLADIAGLPMIAHVARRAAESGLGRVVVATDTRAVADAVRAGGFEAVMTRMDHQSGSDRIFEALNALDPQGQVEIVINVQGDLPTIEPATIAAALAPLADSAVDIGTLGVEISREAERTNPNVVKIVGSALSATRMRALYFTRATAPWGEGPHLPSYRPLRLPARRPGAIRRLAAFAAGDARKARTVAGRGSRHAHRRRDRLLGSSRRRYAGGS